MLTRDWLGIDGGAPYMIGAAEQMLKRK